MLTSLRQSTETAHAGSPTTAAVCSPPPTMLPETEQSLISKEDITSLPSIISLPPPIRPPTAVVVSETVIAICSAMQPEMRAGAAS